MGISRRYSELQRTKKQLSTSLEPSKPAEATNEQLLAKLSAPKLEIEYTHHSERSSMGSFSDAIHDELARSKEREIERKKREKQMRQKYPDPNYSPIADFVYSKFAEMGYLGYLILALSVSFVFLPELTLQIICILTFLFGGFLLVSASLGESLIKGDAWGISFPLIFAKQAGFKLKRKWSEISLVEFSRHNQPSKTPDKVNFYFLNGDNISLNIDGFNRDGLETLALMLSTYYSDQKISPSLKSLNLKVGKSTKELSFTRLWEADMERRFGSTAFVPLEAGDTLQDGRVEIVGQIAFGGLAAVYLARLKKKETVALKEAVLPESSSQETRDKALELFKREAGLLSRINHNQVAQVYDYLVENGRHYLLMEFRDGMDLRRYVNEQGKQNEDTVIRWAGELGEIIKYLHSMDPPVIHRDLTPENIVLEKNSRIAIVDFGAANEFIGTATGTLVGKPSYIPPEQFKGKATKQSDIFALGQTMYFVLTAKDPVPFTPSSPLADGAQISSQLDQLISEATNPELEGRLSSIDEFLERLKNCS